jgi:hypothetical protein
MSDAIQVYSYLDADAPELKGQAGSLIALLDAVLVNGYGQVGVSSITLVGTTATVATSAPHGLKTGDVALISGADQVEYNDEFVVTVTASDEYTIAVSGSPASPATGTITSRRAPAGFTKTFSGTNKAMYRSNDLSSNRHTLRVLDDGSGTWGAREAFVLGCETAIDIDTWTGMFPRANANTGNKGVMWGKSNTSDATVRPWRIYTNGKMIYGYVAHNSPTSNPFASHTRSFAFGDIISYSVGDVYGTYLSGNFSLSDIYDSGGLSQTYNSPGSAINNSLANGNGILARSYTGVDAHTTCVLIGSMVANGVIGGNNMLSYPHPVDNGLYVVPVVVGQSTPNAIRGRMPGLYDSYHNVPLPDGAVVDAVQGLPGRKLMAQWTYYSYTRGCAFIDITGPWD